MNRIFKSKSSTMAASLRVISLGVISTIAASTLYAAETIPNPVAPVIPAPKLAPKLLIISMFQPEAQPWQDHLKFTQKLKVAGLNPQYPTLNCTDEGICQVTTGMGYANVATTVTTLLQNPAFDWRKSYFMVAGIAGMNPHVASTGSVAWSDYVVDYGIAQEFDAREKPKSWPTGYVGIGAFDPLKKPVLEYQNEVFKLDEKLTKRLYELTKATPLVDDKVAQNYRAHYTQATAKKAPFVLTCTTMSGNTWWHGKLLGERATQWGKLLTDGKGEYCTTQQEDNATLTAISRAADAGLADLSRVAVLRSASNYDRPYPNQSAVQSLKANSGGFDISRENLYRVGNAWVTELTTHWQAWE